jgi:hypothetical protein
MLSHCNSGCTNAPQYYVARTLSILLYKALMDVRLQWVKCGKPHFRETYRSVKIPPVKSNFYGTRHYSLYQPALFLGFNIGSVAYRHYGSHGLTNFGFQFRDYVICSGLVVSLWYPRSRVRSRPKPSDFSGKKNPQYAFLQKGSKAV